MKATEALTRLRVVIASHVLLSGPPQELEHFLRFRVSSLLFIGHPLNFDGNKSRATLHEEGIRLHSYTSRWIAPGLLSYFKDFLLTTYWCLRHHRRIDVFVGADGLLALAGVTLKKLGFVKIVVFYSIDYVPTRFKSRMLNRLYHNVERWSIRGADVVWNLAEAMILARRNSGILTNSSALQIVVREGAHFERIQRVNVDHGDKFSLVFLGHLRKRQGLELLIDTLPLIFKRWPDATLTVIGSGPLSTLIAERVTNLGISGRVRLLGFIEDHRVVERILTQCGIGLAPYEPDRESFSWYTEPGKTKQYLACGLPIIITDVPASARVIQAEGAGLIMDYSSDGLIDCLSEIWDDTARYSNMRENAFKLGAEADWKIIFTRALDQTLPLLKQS